MIQTKVSPADLDELYRLMHLHLDYRWLISSNPVWLYLRLVDQPARVIREALGQEYSRTNVYLSESGRVGHCAPD